MGKLFQSVTWLGRHILFRLVLAIPVLIALAIWFYPGLLLWAVVVVREMVNFVVRAFLAAISQRPLAGGAQGLLDAVSFFPKSIFNILAVVWDPFGDKEESTKFFGGDSFWSALRKAFEALLVAASFWAMTLFMLHHAGLARVGLVAQAESFVGTLLIPLRSLLATVGWKPDVPPEPVSSETGKIATGAPQNFIVGLDGVNLRPSPDTQNDPIRKLEPGELLVPTGDPNADTEWLRVVTTRKEAGYVSRRYVSPVAPRTTAQ